MAFCPHFTSKVAQFNEARNNASDNPRELEMPIGRRGLIVPQNTFLEDVIRRTGDLHESFMVGSAEIAGYPVVYCSNGFSQMTGFKRSDVMQSSCDCRFLYGSSVKKSAAEEIQNALRMKITCQVEFIGRKKDGTPVWYLLHVAPIENEENTVVLFLVTVKDITELKEPIVENDAVQKWSKLKQTIKSDRSAFVVAFTKTKEEKNKIRIAQLRVQNSDFILQYKQQIPKPPKWVILHYSSRKVIWDWFVLVFILYTASAVPFAFCFDYDPLPMTIFDILVDVFFIVDIVVNFHTSYLGQDGEVITDLKQIRRYYLRTWFALDLITSLPYGLMLLVSSSNTFVQLISIFKCIRLLRVSRVTRKMNQFINYGFVTLILCLVVFLLCAHLMACLFYLIARSYDNFHEVGWVATLAKQTNQPFNTTEGNRMLPSLASLYVSALYYCLTSLTTIGFGNISPNTTAEKIFGNICMIVGALGYAVIFGQVTAIVQQAQKKSEKYHSLLVNIKSFQKLYRVPSDLSARILDYFMSTWALKKGVDTDEVLKQCPKDLQSDICIHLNRKVLYSNPAFSSMPMSVMRTIARNFCICHVAPGDRVIHEGESLDVLYFISHGSFEVKQDGHVVGLLGQGDVFGDDVCNEATVGKSIADVCALTYSDLHCIDRNDLRDVFMTYPESGVEFSSQLKLAFNLRYQMNRKDRNSVLQFVQDIDSFESTSLSNRAMRHMTPSAGRGRRLSLIQELNQTIDFESSAGDGYSLDSGSVHVKNSRRPVQVSTTVIDEEDEVELREQLPEENENEEAFYRAEIKDNESIYCNMIKKFTTQEIAKLRSEMNKTICEIDSKFSRVENQLALLIRMVQSQKPKPELPPRHSQSFPGPNTSTYVKDDGLREKDPDSRLIDNDSQIDNHTLSFVNNASGKVNQISRSWLLPSQARSSRPNSQPSSRAASPQSRHNRSVSPISNIARHGRRKISNA